MGIELVVLSVSVSRFRFENRYKDVRGEVYRWEFRLLEG